MTCSTVSVLNVHLPVTKAPDWPMMNQSAVRLQRMVTLHGVDQYQSVKVQVMLISEEFAIELLHNDQGCQLLPEF